MKHTESRKWDLFPRKKRWSRNADSEITQMLELSDKDYKTAVTIFLSEIKEHILISEK